ncbi:MAG: TonB-dependent receptor [Gemmatimonadetes bacterium]|nr:TonB-dependent receptor [Gemmatimonadota bacterium]
METTLDAVTVTAGALPVQLRNATRSVEVVTARELRESAASSVDDALRRLSGAWTQRRGAHGTQTDLSLRGGTFGQTLVLLDGMRFGDPQTGHHALQLPLPLAAIDRIEVLPGHGSALLGADALGGAVNIVPAAGGPPRMHAALEGGSFGLRHAALNASWGGEGIPSRTAVDYRASDGWRMGTDFDHLSVSHLSRLESAAGRLSLIAAYADKDFGAFDFYSPGRGIPSRERVRVGFAALGFRRGLGRAELQTSVFVRDLRDRFHFDTRIPDRFINEHHTQLAGGRAQVIAVVREDLTLSAGLEANADRIRSSNLGDHARQWLSLSAATSWHAARWMEADAGLRLDVHDSHRPQLNPTVGLLFRLGEQWSARTSVGRSFRLPTYTDLYYSDPATRGNADLRPESAWSGEAGLRWQPLPVLGMTVTAFRRDQRDLIDYVQQNPGEMFIAMNFSSAMIDGLESSVEWKAASSGWLERAGLSVQLLSTELDTRSAYRTRYALSAPSRLLRAVLAGTLPGRFRWHGTVIAADQQVARDYVTVDFVLRRNIGSISLYIAADNLSNSAIEEFPGLPLHGRWLRAGVEVGLGAE